MLVALMTARAEAQVTPPASPFISAEHWSFDVLRRLDDAGLLPRGADLARQSIPQEEAARLLAYADSAAATHYLERFRREFKAPGRGFVQQNMGAVARGIRNAFAPGIGYDTLAWTGARALDDATDWRYAFSMGLTYAPHLAIGLDAEIGGDDVAASQFIFTAGHFGAWTGFRPLGYGVGNGGGLVLNEFLNQNGGVPQFGVFLPRALRMPLLGHVRFEMHAGKIDNVLNLNGAQRELEPWFWTARGSFEPLPYLRIGINRAMMFGGAGNTPATFERVLKNIVGIYTDNGESNFANQIISIDFRLRVPGLPVIAYLDWGSEDAAGGWWDVPAIMGGVKYARMDSSYDVAIGVEHVQFTRSCCSNGIWYRHAWFRGSWADGERMLGHPLGGHGREWRVFADGSVDGGRLTGHAAVFARRRRAENILAPQWEGKSTGVEAGTDAEITNRFWLQIEGEYERGAADWSTARWSAALRYRF